MAHGKIRVNTLTYDTGSGDVDVAISTIPDAAAMNAKADLVSPQFSGTPQAPNADWGHQYCQNATNKII